MRLNEPALWFEEVGVGPEDVAAAHHTVLAEADLGGGRDVDLRAAGISESDGVRRGVFGDDAVEGLPEAERFTDYGLEVGKGEGFGVRDYGIGDEARGNGGGDFGLELASTAGLVRRSRKSMRIVVAVESEPARIWRQDSDSHSSWVRPCLMKASSMSRSLGECFSDWGLKRWLTTFWATPMMAPRPALSSGSGAARACKSREEMMRWMKGMLVASSMMGKNSVLNLL